MLQKWARVGRAARVTQNLQRAARAELNGETISEEVETRQMYSRQSRSTLRRELTRLLVRVNELEGKILPRLATLEEATWPGGGAERAPMDMDICTTMEWPGVQTEQVLQEPGIVGYEEFEEAQEEMDTHDVLADQFEEGPKRLSPSVWESVVLIGLPSADRGMGGVILIVILANILLKLFFCGIVYANFIDARITEDTLSCIQNWRVNVGHNVRYADQATKTSLVAAVCGGSEQLHISGSQLAMRKEVWSYLGKEDMQNSSSILNGQYLALAAVACWFLSIYNDLAENWELAYNVLLVPRAAPQMVLEETGTPVVRSLSRSQVLLFFTLSALPRLSISLLLGYCGVFFLVYTTNIQDLFLNMLALGMVLVLDELFFATLMPWSVKVLTRKVELGTGPIPADCRCGRFRISGSVLSILRLIALVLSVFYVNQQVLEPFMHNVKGLREELCGGNLDFVYARDEASGVLTVTASRDYAARPRINGGYQEKAVHAAAFAGMEEESSSLVEWGSWLIVTSISRRDVVQASSLLGCWDRVGEGVQHTESATASLRALLGQEDLASCAAVSKWFCFQENMTVLRANCPITCECDKPWQAFSLSHGCPNSCAISSSMREEINELSQLGCLDAEAPLAPWDIYLEGLQNVLVGLGHDRGLVEETCGRLHSNGCSFVAEFYDTLGIDLCNPGTLFRSVVPWCASTCRCQMRMQLDCPNSCPMSER